MQDFNDACKHAKGRVRINPPAMDVIWDDGVAEDLMQAAEAALEAGVSDVAAMYTAVDRIRPEVESFPAELERLLLANGLHPDTWLRSGRSLLHQKLYEVNPPPVKPAKPHNHAHQRVAEVSLKELIERHPDPELADSQGNTALHLLVTRTIDKEYFPNLRGAHMKFHVSSPSDMYRDNKRAKYLTEAFKAMVEAGYKADACNANGKTVIYYLQHGYRRYTGEVAEVPCKGLRDMQRAIKNCLQLVGADVPEPPQRAAVGSPAAARSPAAAGSPAAREPTDPGPTWPYGKFKGMPIKDLDINYVGWLCKNFNFTYKKQLLRQLVDAGKIREGPSGQLVPLSPARRR